MAREEPEPRKRRTRGNGRPTGSSGRRPGQGVGRGDGRARKPGDAAPRRGRSTARHREELQLDRYAAESQGVPNGDELTEEDEEIEFDEFEAEVPAEDTVTSTSETPPAATPKGLGGASKGGRRSLREVLHEFRPSVATGGASAFPLVVLFSLNALDELDRAAFGVLLPEVRDWFGLSIQGITTVFAVAALFPILFSVPVGYFADRWNRTKMAGAGMSIWGVSSFLTAFAPSVFFLGGVRFGSGAGKTLDTAHQALLADYYPPKVRPSVFSFYKMGKPLGEFIGPLVAGGLATVLFWQAPFLLFAVPALILSYIAFFKLREPVRGEQERREQGASEDDAALAEKPPGFTESWRIAKNVRTLRRIWWALPFIVGAAVPIKGFIALFYEEIFGLGPGARGLIQAFDEPFQVAGLFIGGAVATRLLRYRPGRVVSYLGLMAVVAGLSFAVLAVAPVLPLAVAMAYLQAFTIAILAPGATAVLTLVIPPRVRGIALGFAGFFIAPGILFAIIASGLGDAYGLRVGILMLVPVFIIGALIIASAGSTVESDIRRANASAMALLTSREAREKGEAKLLVCKDVDVHYDTVQVLFNVDFEVQEGEMVALLGTNGAGKSTLLRAISGLTPPSNGAVLFDGEDITYLPSSDHAARGIVQVPGGRGIFPTLSVGENLKLAGWMYRRDAEYVRESTERVLEFFPILRERLGEPAGSLSGGEQQMLALGQSFLSRPRLLMIDELSLGLAPAVVEQLLEIVRAIHELGTTIILVEQSVNVALTLADRAVFMEKGEVRFTGPTRDLLQRPDVLRSVFLKGAGGGGGVATTKSAPRRRGPGEEGRAVLEIQGLTKRFGGVRAVNGVDLALEDGEILGLIGPNGAGKTTLFDIISGFVEPDEGRVLLSGDDITALGPDERSKAGLQRSFQNARLFPSLTVSENIAVALEQHLEVRNPVMGAMQLPNVRRAEGRVRRRAERLIEMFSLGDFRDKFVKELSTGSRRIVDLACTVASDPQVILLDEPSSGIAQAEAEELGPLLQRIRYETGCSMLIIEHDMPLITSVSDELVALHLGEVVTRGSAEDVLEHPTVVESYLGTQEEVIRRSGELA